MTLTTARSVDDLLRYADLTDVVLYEVAGRRRDGFDLSDLPADSGETDMRILHNGNHERIRVRCQLKVSTHDGVYSVDAAAIFTLLAPVQVPPDLLKVFAREVGVPAVYPYLRVELHMAARRLGLKPPILRLLKPDDQGTDDASPIHRGGAPAPA